MAAMVAWFDSGRYVADTLRQAHLSGPPPTTHHPPPKRPSVDVVVLDR
jgi:hypothetical protein